MRYIATSNLSGSIEIFLPYLQEAEAYYRYEMLQLESFLVLLSFKNLTKFENSVREYEIEIERDKEKRKRKRKEKREREKRKEKEKREKDTTFRFRESDGSNFFQKTCLQKELCTERVCPSQPYWTFEMAPKFALDVPYNKSESNVNSREDCMSLCLMAGIRNTNEPICRSATYSQNSRTCALSTETRFTRPKDFKSQPLAEYLENQCASRSPASSCSYKTTDNVGVTSVDKLDETDSIEQCQQKCDMNREFVCRSLEFQKSGQFRNKCFLSGDNTETLGGFRTQKLNVVYKERECVTESCVNGIYTFEKMTGVVLRLASVQRELQVSDDRAAKSGYCLQQCRLDGVKCPAVHFSYRDRTCAILDQNSQGRDENLLNNNQAVSFFEKICLRGTSAQQNCRNKDWAFERIIGYQLSSDSYFTSRNSIQNRRDCEEICLSSPTCKSALYESDTLVCKLSEYTRRTRSNKFDLVPDPRRAKINYLENACVPQSTRCSYTNFRDSTAVFADFEANNYRNEDECKNLCDSSASFVCRAYAYSSFLSRCTLSGDDDISARQQDRADKAGTVYMRKACTDSGTRTSTAPPSEDCMNGLSIYEKMTATILNTATTISQSRIPENEDSKTEYCLRQCTESGKSCPAVHYSYADLSCRILDQNSEGRGLRLIRANEVNYFEKVCLQAPPTCSYNKLIDSQTSYQDKISQNVFSEDECKRNCEASRSFFCRSYSYQVSQKICMLSSDDAITTGNSANKPQFGVIYVERTCTRPVTSTTSSPTGSKCESGQLSLIEKTMGYTVDTRFENDLYVGNPGSPGITAVCKIRCGDTDGCDAFIVYYEDRPRYRFNCRYIPERRSTFMTYSTKSIQRIQYAQCLQECDKEPTFDCLSISYVEDIFGQGNCILNSEDVQTAGEFSLQLRAGSTYNGKICDSVIPVTTTARPIQCEPGQYSFEKLTGYDVSEAHQEMNAIIDVKDLTTSCAKECLRLESICDAFVIDYSRKMCFSIKTREQLFPNSNYFSQNLDISYFKKICLPDNPCSTKTWAFDRVLDFFLTDNVAKELNNVGSRVECERACQREIEFKCASANYFNNEKICQLSAESRRTQPGSFSERRSVDYLDNHCAEDPPSCKYQSREEKFLPFTDKSLKGSSEEQCKLSCETEPELPCRSYNWDKVRGECYLSSDDTWSRPEGEQALLSGFNYANYVYGEKGRCEQVRVACDEEAMVISLSFSQTFNGVVYARSKAKECSVPVNGESQTTLTLPLGIECGTIAESKVRYVNEVIVQKHPIIQTINDKHIKVVCTFDKAEQVHKLWLLEVWVEKGIFKSRKYNLEFYIQFKNLDGDMMTLIDINGCPPEASIFPALQYDPRDGKSQFATFKAFRFRTSGYITFKAQITFCQDSCKPVTCRDNMESVGRKRRDFPTELFVDDSESEFGSGDEDLPETTDLVENAIGTTPELIPTEEHELNYNTETSTEWQNSEDDVEEAGYMVVPDATNDESDDSSGNDLSETSITSETPNSSTTGGYEELDNEHTTQETVQPTTLFKSSKIPSTTRITTSFPTVRKTKPKTIPTIPTRTPTYSNHRNPYESGYQRDSKQHIYNSPRQEYDYPSNKRRPVIMPSDTPLKYSLLVSPDKNDYLAEDRAEGAAHTGISPKRDYSETFTLYENDKICSDRTTVIVSITTVIILHLIIIVSGLIYYRYRKKRRNKNLDYEYTAGPPLPKRNNQSAGNSGILARPNMTFRNIYGYTTAPTSSTASTSSAAAT
ncbi:hypothetical protein GQR58_009584 [Nymphon striatum]|nr:hypothetical protein GQR58_009584 [Nymphon striatum]